MEVIRNPFSHNVTYAFTLDELQDRHSIFSLQPEAGTAFKIQVDCPAGSNTTNKECITLLTNKGILDAFNRAKITTVSLQRTHKVPGCLWMQTINSAEPIVVHTREGRVVEKLRAPRKSSWSFGSQAPDDHIRISNPMRKAPGD